MERFWTLKYLAQNAIAELEATVFKDNLVRADTLPLVLPVMGAQGLPRGARVRVKLGEADLITLDIHGTVLERLDTGQAETAEDAVEAEDDEEVVTSIAIAVDVSEAPEAALEPPPT